MGRKSRPLKTGQGEFIKSIEQRIREKEYIKKEIKKEIEKYLSVCCENNGTLKGINYSYDRVKGGAGQQDFVTIVNKIDGLRANLNKINEELTELKEKKKKLEKMYGKANDIETRIFYFREILEYSQKMTAVKVGYSIRQVQRIEKKIKEKYGVRF